MLFPLFTRNSNVVKVCFIFRYCKLESKKEGPIAFLKSIKNFCRNLDTKLDNERRSIMIDQRFIVQGKDFKNLPLKAAYYARSLGCDHNKRLKGIINWIEFFVETETSWDLVVGYEDNNCSSQCMSEQFELEELLDDADNPIFDLIVVSNFCQISRNKELINYLLKDGALKVPVFCIDTETIISSNPENLKDTLFYNDKGSISDYYIHQIEDECNENSK